MVRPSDTLARLGGDEFALLLEGVREEQAAAIAGRLLDEPPSRCGSPAASSRSAPASGSSCTPAAAATARSSSVTPTSRCTPPRRRPRPARDLPLRDGARARRAARPRARAAPGAAARGARGPLPARGRARQRHGRRCRGAAALALADPRHRLAGAVHPGGRGIRADRRDRGARAPGGLPADGAVERDGLLPERFITWVNVSAKQLRMPVGDPGRRGPRRTGLRAAPVASR